MKIKIEAKALAKAMKFATASLQSTAIIPILANVRLIANGDTLEITTGDFDTELRQTIPLDGKGEMATTVNAKKLASLASAAPAGAILNMSLGDARLTVTAGKSRWVLPVLPADDYPTLPTANLCKPLKIAGPDIAKAIRRVSWAVFDDMASPHLSGVLFDKEGNALRVVAVYRYGLALAETDATFPKDAPTIVVPSKCAGLLADMADAHGDEVTVQWDGSKIRAEIGSSVLTGKLIDGTFPDYRRVIPKLGTPIVFDPSAMSDAIKRVLVITEEKSRTIKIKRCDGKVMLHTTDALAGMSSEEVAAECVAGKTTGLNGQVFAEIVAAIGGDSIEMHQSGDPKSAPAMFRRVVNDGVIALTMPMRI